MTESNFGIKEKTGVISSGLNEFIQICQESAFAFAIWRVPGQNITGILDVSPTECDEIELENASRGFYFHPYDSAHQRHFIKATIRFTFEDGLVQFSEPLPRELEKKFKQAGPTPADHGKDKVTLSYSQQKNEESQFVGLVDLALKEISLGLFQKVVPSRRLGLHIENIDFNQILNALTVRYPNAFVSFTFIPATGIWIGASPEVLVNTNQGKIFETVALAGTQALQPGQSLSEVAWRQKEIEEQAYVSRYIINCFKKIRLREFDEIGPKTVVAGNLIHLKTTFRVDMEAVNFPQLGSVMLKLLHPTSAVCGMPRQQAFDWLKANEGYDRGYFSGFLGPVNMDGNTSLYVNLRCMNIEGNQAWIYAGAGVTEDSQPAKEWEETSIKMNTLLDIIG